MSKSVNTDTVNNKTTSDNYSDHEEAVKTTDDLNKSTIQRATPQDLPAIVAIYNQAIVTKMATADLDPITIEDKQDWFNTHQTSPNRPIFVVKNTNNELMAWGCFSDIKARAAYHISSEISIYVANDFKNQRIASTLLDWMLAQAPSLGIQTILAYIFSHNLPSIALFSKFDFTTWGKLSHVCDMEGFIADVTIMGKQL